MGYFGPYIGAKREHKGYFSTSGAILAPIFGAVFGPLEGILAHQSHFGFLKHGLVLPPSGPEQNIRAVPTRCTVLDCTRYLHTALQCTGKGFWVSGVILDFSNMGAVLVPRRAKTEHKGCFSTSGTITAPIFSTVFAKLKCQIGTIANLIEKTHLFE